MKMTHEHIWIKDTSRTHGRPPRYFVKCSACPATAQAVDTVSVGEKYRRIFNTGYSHGGPSFQIRGRLKIKPYHKKLQRCGKNVAEIVRKYLDTVE